MRKIDRLQEVKAILKELEFSLEQRKGIWKQLQGENPNFPQLSEMHWKEIQNNSWIVFRTLKSRICSGQKKGIGY